MGKIDDQGLKLVIQNRRGVIACETTDQTEIAAAVDAMADVRRKTLGARCIEIEITGPSGRKAKQGSPITRSRK